MACSIVMQPFRVCATRQRRSKTEGAFRLFTLSGEDLQMVLDADVRDFEYPFGGGDVPSAPVQSLSR